MTVYQNVEPIPVEVYRFKLRGSPPILRALYLYLQQTNGESYSLAITGFLRIDVILRLILGRTGPSSGPVRHNGPVKIIRDCAALDGCPQPAERFADEID